MSVRVGGKPLPTAQYACDLGDSQNLMNSIAACFSSSLARAETAKCTDVPSVTCCAGPLGTIAKPKSMPADLKPVVIHGPTTSIAAFFDWNSLSASAPERPTGEIFLLRTRFD